MAKFGGLGERLSGRFRALGYWKRTHPDVLRFCREKDYRPQYVYAWLKDRVKRWRQAPPQYRLYQNEWVRQRMGFGDTVPSELRKIGPGLYDNVVLVSSRWTGAEEEADARTILAYLLVREILPAAGPQPSILAEIMDAENLELFTRASCETVQPTVILSHMLAQVVLRRELGAVYQELFGPGGAEILYRKAKEYDLLGCPVRFAELQAAAARHGEIMLGLHFASSSSAESGALLNPPRDETFVLAADDDLIVLASYSSLPCL